MRVLAITSSYPRFDGDPTAPFVESITRGLAEHGHEIHLVLPESSSWRRVDECGIQFHPCRYSPRGSWTPWGYSGALEGGVRIRRPLYALAPVVLMSMYRKCRRLAVAKRFDLVHAHWVIPNGPIGARVAERFGLPFVVSLHGSDISVAERSTWAARAACWSFQRAAVVTAPSEDMLERARPLGAQGRLEVIPYGGDADAFHVQTDVAAQVRERLGVGSSDTLVLGIGRLVRVKGFDVLIDAIAEARLGSPHVRLVLVGDGDLRDALEKQARERGVHDRVTFAGMARRDEVPGYLAAADVVVVPSVHFKGYVDGLPNVALEAMAASRAVVASRVGGLPHVIDHGENGFLVEERDVRALAAAIEVLVSNPALRRAMGEKGNALVRGPLSWGSTVRRFASVYAHAARTDGTRTA